MMGPGEQETVHQAGLYYPVERTVWWVDPYVLREPAREYPPSWDDADPWPPEKERL